MALTDKALFLYGFQVTTANRFIDFRIANGGTIYTATLRLGYYSLTSLLNEIVRAMTAANNSVFYSVTADRTIAGGLENRVSINTSGVWLELLFATGSNAASSCAALIGFNAADYTGALTYTGSSTCGTALVTEYPGHTFTSPECDQKVQGVLNVAANGSKEAVVFQITPFWSVEHRYEPRAKVVTQWQNLMKWMIQQRRIEYTPEVNSPTVFYEGTLESSAADGKGLGFKMSEQLPQLPNKYTTGMMRFRQTV